MLVEFCLPVYNEARIIKNSILTLLNYCENQNYDFAWKIVIVINGSTDHTLKISQELQRTYPDKIIIVNYLKAGRGSAFKNYWPTSEADIIAYMDIDLAVNLDYIKLLIEPLVYNQADLMIGSRLMPDSKIKRSFIRELTSQGYNFLSRVILRHNFSDMQCGFKAIKVEVFKKIFPYLENKSNFLDKIFPFLYDRNWFFDTELIILTKLFDYRIKEIPVDWSENRYDERKSKVHMLRDSFRFFYNLIKLKIKILKIKK
jgi:glycosyltransferase involved in cell wall biosynthesis